MCIYHVLVVDDEPSLAEVVQQYLEHFGFKVTIAKDADTALALNQIDPADAVITDFRMPGMNGQELLNQLRKARPNLPGIIVSGFLGAFEQNEDERTKVFIKPTRLQKLMQCLRDMPCETTAARLGVKT